MTSPFKKYLSLASIFLVAACATPAHADQKTVVPESGIVRTLGNNSFKANPSVMDVTGGRETNPMQMSNVSGRDFVNALEASLRGAASSNIHQCIHEIVALKIPKISIKD